MVATSSSGAPAQCLVDPSPGSDRRAIGYRADRDWTATVNGLGIAASPERSHPSAWHPAPPRPTPPRATPPRTCTPAPPPPLRPVRLVEQPSRIQVTGGPCPAPCPLSRPCLSPGPSPGPRRLSVSAPERAAGKRQVGARRCRWVARSTIPARSAGRRSPTDGFSTHGLRDFSDRHRRFERSHPRWRSRGDIRAGRAEENDCRGELVPGDEAA